MSSVTFSCKSRKPWLSFPYHRGAAQPCGLIGLLHHQGRSRLVRPHEGLSYNNCQWGSYSKKVIVNLLPPTLIKKESRSCESTYVQQVTKVLIRSMKPNHYPRAPKCPEPHANINIKLMALR